MEYKIELVKNSKIISSHSVSATHPNQVIRKAINSVNKNNYIIYIMSESGLVWVYYVNELLQVKLLDKQEIYGVDLDYIRSGNKSISGVLQK